MRLLDDGYAPVDVVRMVGVDRRSVRRWKATARRRGSAALAAKPAAGRPPKLDARARQWLERLLLRGAQAAGFPLDLWTCPRVAQAITAHFGVTYHVAHLGRLLRALGFRPQQPQRRVLERDEAAIQRWIKQIHPVFFPPYAPELNPIELAWGYLKCNPLANWPLTEIDRLTAVTHYQRRHLQRDHDLLRSFIEHRPLPLRLK